MKAINFKVFKNQVAILILALVVIFCPIFLHAQDNTFSLDEEFEKSAQLIVMLKAGAEFGAGIIIGREKDRLLIVTAHHIVKDAEQASKIEVQFRGMPQNKYVAAKLLQHGQKEGLDLAVLSVEGLQQQGFDVCNLPFDRLGKVNKVKRGNIAYPLGNPNGVSWAIPVEPDRVSGIDSNEIIFQSDFISKGHSGGGLIDERGKLIGMTIADAPPFGRAINLGTIIELVMKWGYMVQLYTAREDGLTPLHVAAQDGDLIVLQNLLEDCGDANVTDDNEAVPLHYSAANNHIEAMSLLIKAGANLDALDAHGRSPLAVAVKEKDLESVSFLIKSGAKINYTDEYGRKTAPLEVAIDAGDLEIIKKLIAAGGKANVNMLYYPIIDSKIDLVKVLLPVLDNLNNSLDHASYKSFYNDNNGETLLNLAIEHNNPEIVNLLVTSGADINGQGNAKKTPFFNAVYYGNVEILKTLLKASVNVNSKSAGGWTAFHLIAELNTKNSIEVIKLLLDAGGDINAKDSNGKTPLTKAVEYKNETIAKFLISRGAK